MPESAICLFCISCFPYFLFFNTTLADYRRIFSLSPFKIIVYHRRFMCHLIFKSSEKEGGRVERCLHGRLGHVIIILLLFASLRVVQPLSTNEVLLIWYYTACVVKIIQLSSKILKLYFLGKVTLKKLTIYIYYNSQSNKSMTNLVVKPRKWTVCVNTNILFRLVLKPFFVTNAVTLVMNIFQDRGRFNAIFMKQLLYSESINSYTVFEEIVPATTR